MKRLLLVASIFIASAVFIGGQAHALGLPLSYLAGNWAGQGTATFAICFNSDFSSVVDCSDAENTAFYSQVLLFQQTVDTKGNSCTTVTATNSPEFPFPPSPANTFTQVSVTQVTSYNQSTESGTASFTNYNAGPGTYCNGSVLVNTAGSSPVSIGTNAVTISQLGNHADIITQTFTAKPLSDVANDVTSGYLNRQ